jgi:hypothetical protein
LNIGLCYTKKKEAIFLPPSKTLNALDKLLELVTG